MIIPIIIVTVIGLLAGLILSIVSKLFAVEVDERIEKIREELPGANCGACGFAGCDEYAAKLVKEGVKPNLCVPGASAVAKKISEILGVEFESVEEKYAVVACKGNCDVTDDIVEYMGRKSCAACNSFYQGKKICTYACLGYGDCVNVCQYDAIHIVNGVAVVDYSRCVGCGMCARACPNHIIQLIPTSSHVAVQCSSKDKGAYTRSICKAGCIGCKKCEKTCPNGAITVENNLAHIDPSKCTNCGACFEACPVKAIGYVINCDVR